MIDSIYKTVQAILNKEQLGYLKPMDFNLFIANAQRKIYDNYLHELKLNQRRENWHLEGKNLSNLSEHIKQLVEHFSFEETITVTSGAFDLPDDLEYVEDVFNENTRIDKVDYADFLDLKRNIYARPSNCTPVCSKVGRKIKINPTDISEVDLHYLRKPKTPKWTGTEFQGKPMFAPTASDYQDVDMPNEAYDELVTLVTEMASQSIRELQITQLQNQEQNQDAQNQNRQ